MRAGALIVGAGLMGRWHGEAIARAGRRVAAVVDLDLDRARSLGRRHRGSSAATDLDAALARQPFAVHLCTPTSTHEDLVRRALEAGCHVLVEKPLAASYGATRRLLDLAADRHLTLCPVHQFLFQRGVRRVERRMPELGPIRHIDFVTCSAGAERLAGDERDRIAIEILPHPFALFVRLLRERFDALTWDTAHSVTGEIRAMGHGGGMSAGILVSMSGRPTINLLRVIGERGTLHADLFHGFAVLEAGAVSRSRKLVRPFLLSGATLLHAAANLVQRAAARELAYPGLTELVRRFYRAAESGRPNPVPAAETLAVADAIERVTASIANASRCC